MQTPCAQCNSQHESDCCFSMKGIIQHVLLHLPASLCIRYRTSGLKTREETSCPRIDDSVSNIPKLTNTDQASVTISVPPWGCDTRHHITCYCLNVRGLFDPIIISSQSHSGRTSRPDGREIKHAHCNYLHQTAERSTRKQETPLR